MNHEAIIQREILKMATRPTGGFGMLTAVGGILRVVDSSTMNARFSQKDIENGRPGKQVSEENIPQNKQRKTLQTLQPAASRGLTRSNHQIPAKHSRTIIPAKKVEVYSDPADALLRRDQALQTEQLSTQDRALQTVQPSLEERGFQTEQQLQDECLQTEPLDCDCDCHGHQLSAEEEAHRLMVQEEVPLEYWKQLAEQRRLALNDSLHENEQLHNELQELQEENGKLSELAGQAEYFSEMLTMLTEDGPKGATEEQQEEEQPSESEEPSSTAE